MSGTYISGTRGTGILTNTAYIVLSKVSGGVGDGIVIKNGNIYSSTISGNMVGIRVSGAGTVIANRDNLNGNRQYTIVAGMADVNAEYNFWDAERTDTISPMLLDRLDNFKLGTIDFGDFVYVPYSSNPDN